MASLKHYTAPDRSLGSNEQQQKQQQAPAKQQPLDANAIRFWSLSVAGPIASQNRSHAYMLYKKLSNTFT